MFESVLQADPENCSVVCSSPKPGSGISGASECFSEGRRTRYDNQTEPSLGDEVHHAEL